MSKIWIPIVLLGVALALVACTTEDDKPVCPTTGTATTGGTFSSPTSISLAVTYVAPNGSTYGDTDYYQFTATTSGNYSGCVGTNTVVDLGWTLYDSFNNFIAECDKWWEDESTHERCSTSEGGFTLFGGSAYKIGVENWGPIYNVGTYGLTVTKD